MRRQRILRRQRRLRGLSGLQPRSDAAFSLDGGGDGKSEDVAARVAKSESFARAARATAMAA